MMNSRVSKDEAVISGRQAVRISAWGNSLVGPARRKAQGGRCGRSLKVLAVALGALTIAAAGLASGALAAEPPARSSDGKVPLIYQKKRSFRIPFKIDAEGRARLKEIQLWVSEDSGFHWEPKSKTTPDLGKFTFRTSHDGEFWFATRTLTVEDEYSPPMNQTVEPSMKVVVDTVPPSLVLEPDGRRGSLAGVRWEVKDEHLDLKTLLLEYQVDGAKEWRQVPIRRPALLGTQRWDAGTADSLRVRASVADKAGNVADAEIVMPEGTAGDPDFAAVDAETSAPPVEQISSSASAIAAGPGFPPVQESPVQGPSSTARPAARRSLARRTRRCGKSGHRNLSPGSRLGPRRRGNGSRKRPSAQCVELGTASGRRSGLFQSISDERHGRGSGTARSRRCVSLNRAGNKCRSGRGHGGRESLHAGSQSPVQTSVCHRRRRSRRSGRRGTLDDSGRRQELDSSGRGHRQGFAVRG